MRRLAVRLWLRIGGDRWPLDRRGSDAICAVAVMHIAQAALLLQSAAAANATSVAALIYAFAGFGIFVGMPDLVAGLPLVMIFTAAMALVGALFRIGRPRLALFFPQHFLLFIMLVGAAIAVSHGAYLDHTPKPWQHIAADQLPVLVLFYLHARAIIRRAREPNG